MNVMRALAVSLIALVLPMQAQANERKVNQLADVDGRTYRVMVKGEEVHVFDKAFGWKQSPEQRNRMRRAVVLATGCYISNDYWAVGQGRLKGSLDCPQQSGISSQGR